MLRVRRVAATACAIWAMSCTGGAADVRDDGAASSTGTAGTDGLEDPILGNPSLAAFLESAAGTMRDQHMPNRYAALAREDNGVQLALAWSKRHLTREALGDPELVNVDEIVVRHGRVGGTVACIDGWLEEVHGSGDALEFTLRHQSGRVSGGWLVGVESVPAPKVRLQVCGVIIGRRIQEDEVAKGLFLIGRSRAG